MVGGPLGGPRTLRTDMNRPGAAGRETLPHPGCFFRGGVPASGPLTVNEGRDLLSDDVDDPQGRYAANGSVLEGCGVCMECRGKDTDDSGACVPHGQARHAWAACHT